MMALGAAFAVERQSAARKVLCVQPAKLFEIELEASTVGREKQRASRRQQPDSDGQWRYSNT